MINLRHWHQVARARSIFLKMCFEPHLFHDQTKHCRFYIGCLIANLCFLDFVGAFFRSPKHYFGLTALYLIFFVSVVTRPQASGLMLCQALFGH